MTTATPALPLPMAASDPPRRLAGTPIGLRMFGALQFAPPSHVRCSRSPRRA